MRNFLLFLIILIIAAVVGFFLWDQYINKGDELPPNTTPPTNTPPTTTPPSDGNGDTPPSDNGNGSTPPSDGNGDNDSDNGANGDGTDGGVTPNDTPIGDDDGSGTVGDNGNLPSTALISDEVDRVLLGVITIMFSIALFKTNIIGKLFFPLPDYLRGDFFGVDESDKREQRRLQKQLTKINKNLAKKLK